MPGQVLNPPENNKGNQLNGLQFAIEQLATGMTQVSNLVNEHDQKITSMSQQFNEAIAVLAKLTPLIQQGAPANGGNGKGNGQINPVTGTPIQATTGEIAPVPVSPGVNPNGMVNVPGIMDKLLQVYLATKQTSADPMQQLMASMDLGMGLITKMGQFISTLKGDWLKDQKMALDTMKTDVKISKSPKVSKGED